MASAASPAGTNGRSPSSAPWAKLRLFVSPDDESVVVRFWTDWASDEAVRDGRREFFDMMVSAMKRAPAGCVSFVPAPQKWWVVKGADAAKAVINNFHELGFQFLQSDVHRIFESLSSRALASQASTNVPTHGVPLGPLPTSQGGAASSPRPTSEHWTSSQQLSQQPQPLQQQQQPLQQLQPSQQHPASQQHLASQQWMLPQQEHIGSLGTSMLPAAADTQQLTPASANDGPMRMPSTRLPASTIGAPVPVLCSAALSASPSSTCPTSSAPLSPPLPHFGGTAPSSSCSSLRFPAQETQRWPMHRRPQPDAAREVIDIPDSPEPAADTVATQPVGTGDSTSNTSAVGAAADNSVSARPGPGPGTALATSADTGSVVQPGPNIPEAFVACNRRTLRPIRSNSADPVAGAHIIDDTVEQGSSSAVTTAVDTNTAAEPGTSSSGEKRSVDAQDQQATSKQAKSCQPECTICMDAVADTVFVPCGHLVSCGDCAAQLKRKPCPVCRKKIKIAQKVFMS